MWPSTAKWLKLYVEASSSLPFHSAGQLLLPGLTLLLSHSSHCPQFTPSCKVMLKEKGMCHRETLSYRLGQPRWSPAVSLAG